MSSATAGAPGIRAWLSGQRSLGELRAAFPEEWQAVQSGLAVVVAAGELERLKSYTAEVSRTPPPGSRVAQLKAAERAVVAAHVRRQMTALALKQMAISAATGVTEGRLRFNLLNGYVAQKLLFEHDLTRKPVSLTLFRLVWPLLWQRRYLMPLVEPKGIYCFYSKRLIHQLAELIGERACLEIAAGDGTLSRFLKDAGVVVTATDDHSWGHSVAYPAMVHRQEAREALRARRPGVVICSWPPADNSFERNVFRTESVQLYIVIGSRHRFAAGNWTEYEQQTGFELVARPDLGNLVVPPELDPAVYLFRRTSPQGY